MGTYKQKAAARKTITFYFYFQVALVALSTYLNGNKALRTVMEGIDFQQFRNSPSLLLAGCSVALFLSACYSRLCVGSNGLKLRGVFLLQSFCLACGLVMGGSAVTTILQSGSV